MNELKIREDGIYLNNQKLKGVQAIKTKSTAECNHATVYLKFIAKLIWNEVGIWFRYITSRKENGMNELERTALNEVLRTVRLINQKVAEVVELQSQQELAITYLRGIMDGSLSDWLSLELVE